MSTEGNHNRTLLLLILILVYKLTHIFVKFKNPTLEATTSYFVTSLKKVRLKIFLARHNI